MVTTCDVAAEQCQTISTPVQAVASRCKPLQAIASLSAEPSSGGLLDYAVFICVRRTSTCCVEAVQTVAQPCSGLSIQVFQGIRSRVVPMADLIQREAQGARAVSHGIRPDQQRQVSRGGCISRPSTGEAHETAREGKSKPNKRHRA